MINESYIISMACTTNNWTCFWQDLLLKSERLQPYKLHKNFILISVASMIRHTPRYFNRDKRAHRWTKMMP